MGDMAMIVCCQGIGSRLDKAKRDEWHRKRFPGRPRATGFFDSREELEAAVRALKLQRLPQKTIAYKTGVSRKTVWSILRAKVHSE